MHYFTSRITSTNKTSRIGASTHLSGNSDGTRKRDYTDFHRYMDGHNSRSDDTDLEEQSVSKLVESSEEASPTRNFLPFMGNKPVHDAAPPISGSTAPPYPGGRSLYPDPDVAPPAPAVTAHHKSPSGGWRSNITLGQTHHPATNPNDAIALASLDPRNRTAPNGRPEDLFPKGRGANDNVANSYHTGFGTTTEAKTVPALNTPPLPGDDDRANGVYPIEVKNEFRLERE